MNWMASSGGKVRSSPAVWSLPNGTDVAYFGSNDNNFYGVSSVDGSTVFHYATAETITGSASIDSHGRVFFGSQDFYFYCINGSSGLSQDELCSVA